ncbi:low molecular weight phosphotyrosine protein phosphatase [Pseudarthrobacter phenanthrenivorans]|uniref:protein-tyrosine-phosphatase n=2 Tax=Pseudarthrobacter phenanthrenivorans TaxID=361575 RepID=A0A3B0FQL3_PSEPS|nr:low molecular weight protein-tyrosine-phosphatase [Pseudarthrobacter phenanthrenivorans]RKO22120.1 low molecular weight phosphotyrosine protein phosphatase [Pseudarthrobacter phenanthrenivorans]TPV50645.1 low molecular weight phosphotyrosine protein phosphatase [Pseudarthrobacter phenanthrenivorans]
MNSTSSPYRVIAVCTGNICRSPMAELMLTAALERAGLDRVVSVDSAGTTGYEAGRPIDPRAARRLAATQLASQQHIAREWVHDWFRERDLILALDIDHYAWLSEAAPDQESLEKIRMLRSFDPAMAGRDLLDQGIEDPWYGGHADFDAVWHQIHAALPGIVDHIRAAVLRGAELQRQIH